MAEPNYEKGVSAALQECLDSIEHQKDEFPTAMVRVGTVHLENGQLAEIQLQVTSDPDLLIGQEG